MRARLLIATLVLLGLFPGTVWGQGVALKDSARVSFEKSYSIEIGTGIRPFQMMINPLRAAQVRLAPKGQDVDTDGSFYPVVNLTGVLRSGWKTEFTLSAGASWYHHRLIQYPSFGMDPDGKPRYDLEHGERVGWMDSIPAFSGTFQWRHLWNPSNAFLVYTALGAGVTVSYFSPFFPLLSLTPVAFRYGGEHFYAYTEMTLGPLASFVHGGLGWRF